MVLILRHWLSCGPVWVSGLLALALMALPGCDAPPPQQSGQALWEADPQALLVSSQGPLPGPASLQGHPLAVFFGYSQCPDICPTGLSELGQALTRLSPQERAGLRAVFVTLDPARDTPEVLAHYVALFHPDLLALRLHEEPLKTLARAFRVYYKIGPTDANGGYAVDHTAHTALVDAQGRLVKLVPYGAKADRLADAIRGLL